MAGYFLDRPHIHPPIFPKQLPAVYKSSNSCISSPTLSTSHLFYFSHSCGCVMVLHCGFNFYFLGDYRLPECGPIAISSVGMSYLRKRREIVKESWIREIIITNEVFPRQHLATGILQFPILFPRLHEIIQCNLKSVSLHQWFLPYIPLNLGFLTHT